MTYQSRIANAWDLQGETELARAAEQSYLKSIMKSKHLTCNPEFRIFSYSPDSKRITIRGDCNIDKSFWLHISFYAGQSQHQKLALQTCGREKDASTQIIAMTDDGFTLCAKSCNFVVHVDISFAKLKLFISSK